MNNESDNQKEIEKIDLDSGTAFALKLQEFDKNISEAELLVAKLKHEKSCYIFNLNVDKIIKSHKEWAVKTQIEQETKRKLEQQKNQDETIN